MTKKIKHTAARTTPAPGIAAVVLLTACALLASVAAGYRTASAKITEKELQKYNTQFLSRILYENSTLKPQIRQCLQGIVKSDEGGIRILDKFGLFIYDCQQNGITLKKIKYLYNDSINYFFLILEDKNDNQLYTLYLEYGYDAEKKAYTLTDIYFSLVFNERMKDIEKFFKYR